MALSRVRNPIRPKEIKIYPRDLRRGREGKEKWDVGVKKVSQKTRGGKTKSASSFSRRGQELGERATRLSINEKEWPLGTYRDEKERRTSTRRQRIAASCRKDRLEKSPVQKRGGEGEGSHFTFT